MLISIDLHVKCQFTKSERKENGHLFFSWNFDTVFGKQIAIFYQILSQGAVEKVSLINKGDFRTVHYTIGLLCITSCLCKQWKSPSAYNNTLYRTRVIQKKGVNLATCISLSRL